MDFRFRQLALTIQSNANAGAGGALAGRAIGTAPGGHVSPVARAARPLRRRLAPHGPRLESERDGARRAAPRLAPALPRALRTYEYYNMYVKLGLGGGGRCVRRCTNVA